MHTDDDDVPPLTLAGPLWTGPLHDADWLRDMAAAAAARHWTGHCFSDAADVKRNGHNPPQHLEAFLSKLIAESDDALPPWFVPLHDIQHSGGLTNEPSRDKLVQALKEAGYVACDPHVEVRQRWCTCCTSSCAYEV